MSRTSREAVSSKKSKKTTGKLKLIITILAALVAVGGIYTNQLGPVDRRDDAEVIVEIPTGTGAIEVVNILDNNGLVKNPMIAKIQTKIGHYNNLQANTYVFSKKMSFTKMMRAINTGDFNYISKETIEIKDGWRLNQLADAMSEELNISSKKIMTVWNDKAYLKTLIDKYWFLTDEILADNIMYPLEGYLYADTYFITTDNSTIEGFTEMCLDRMDVELSARRDAINKSGFTVHQLLTLTSIVTKEAGANDQAHIAGLFVNRLKNDISLGSDATVCYIFQEDRVELKVSQLNSDSPYNTRKVVGLTPGPICSVVADTIDATLGYEETDDVFFFTDENGVNHYFKTEAEFEKGLQNIELLKDDEETE